MVIANKKMSQISSSDPILYIEHAPCPVKPLSVHNVTPYSSFQRHSHPSSSTLQWRHHDHDGVSSHQPHDCLLNRLFRHTWKKTSKLRVTGLCDGNSPATGEFSAQRASNAENVSIWWRHHEISCFPRLLSPSPSVTRLLDIHPTFPLCFFSHRTYAPIYRIPVWLLIFDKWIPVHLWIYPRTCRCTHMEHMNRYSSLIVKYWRSNSPPFMKISSRKPGKSTYMSQWQACLQTPPLSLNMLLSPLQWSSEWLYIWDL